MSSLYRLSTPARSSSLLTRASTLAAASVSGYTKPAWLQQQHQKQPQQQQQRRLQHLQLRTMSSAAADKSEWLVVVPDAPGMLSKRLEVRPTHLANLKGPVDSGVFKFGGAVLEDLPDPKDASSIKFAGSTLIMLAASRADVVAILESDVYAKEGVWDVSKAQIWPLKTAFRNP